MYRVRKGLEGYGPGTYHKDIRNRSGSIEPDPSFNKMADELIIGLIFTFLPKHG